MSRAGLMVRQGRGGSVYHLGMSRLSLRDDPNASSDDEQDVTPLFPDLEDEIILED